MFYNLGTWFVHMLKYHPSAFQIQYNTIVYGNSLSMAVQCVLCQTWFSCDIAHVVFLVHV